MKKIDTLKIEIYTERKRWKGETIEEYYIKSNINPDYRFSWGRVIIDEYDQPSAERMIEDIIQYLEDIKEEG